MEKRLEMHSVPEVGEAKVILDVKKYLEDRMMDRASTLRVIDEWPCARILEYKQRVNVVTVLIQKASEYGMPIPPLWRDILARPDFYEESAQLALGIDSDDISPSPIDTHPQ